MDGRERPVEAGLDGAGADAVPLRLRNGPGDGWMRALWIGMVSGGVAGTCVDLALFPLDTIKTRLQASPAASGVAAARSSTWLFAGLYRGIGPALAASAPCGALFFATYDISKHVLFASDWFRELERASAKSNTSSHVKIATLGIHMTAAMLGDAVSSVVRTPFEVVKQQMQAAHAPCGVVPSASMLAQSMWRSNMRGSAFYGAYLSLLFRELPFDLIEYPLYEYLRSKESAQGSGSVWFKAGCGVLAGGIAASITTPLDVAKTRIMLQDQRAPRYTGVAQAINKIWKEEGASALYRGVVPRTAWISLGGGIFFGFYEATKALLQPQ
ncbi:putative mitochondrial carrier protein PET8 [Porphyridium purpureum]|uniref:Putative mitochondrial carrier protein PET8 n=1 Tax=Porphyridium purpureum TaxID=35688 RepID=A0A5J4Z670_PORPP|nr:putative mitochondrial carrier protein PET8 [Porphyridium purpureum]|eukprot:POR8521..scf295_1